MICYILSKMMGSGGGGGDVEKDGVESKSFDGPSGDFQIFSVVLCIIRRLYLRR